MVRCQNCDERLGKYECGKGHTEMRQVVANITQSTRNVHDSVSLRRMDVSLPRVFPSEAACVWCPRNPKGSGNGRSVPPRPISGSQLKLEREAAHVEDTLQLSTVLPQWSPGTTWCIPGKVASCVLTAPCRMAMRDRARRIDHGIRGRSCGKDVKQELPVPSRQRRCRSASVWEAGRWAILARFWVPDYTHAGLRIVPVFVWMGGADDSINLRNTEPGCLIMGELGS